MTKQTLNGTNRKIIRVSGFRARMQTKTGRKILNKRRIRGRKKLTILYKK
jgi:large subunit ribosomal protein L34|uniref:Large ribosomal subunit protein bL34c n=1 Tax=Vaucheria litorea TaxID=109269 RepID=B7T233_VAULI|nr:ribosomal protein L34 [Vaucheria litorea]ACF70999.1 ribosomal protein L34 [Vaucheria litorea]